MTLTVATKTQKDEVISSSPVKLVDEVISRAFTDKASDVHIEPGEHECRVRIRIDGSLVYIGRYRKEIHEEVVARLKVLSTLRTDVRLSPQDGRFKVNVSNVPIHVRVSVVPSFYGEKCVLRLLPVGLQSHSLESLGFSKDHVDIISDILSATHGMILVVGPTGSGKTTTLYTVLRKILSPEISAVTLEDPIEYSIPGITQIPIHTGSTMTFATALRAVVRQDPDLIMVGEIRDTSTAELATHVALTGHLLLSTLHTNDAVTALPRLMDMGVEPFLVASTVRAIVSQRLVRKICAHCKKQIVISESEFEYLRKTGLAFTPEHFKAYRGQGCAYCRNTGYHGRTVIAEVLAIDEGIKGLIMQKVSSAELRKTAALSGMLPLISDAIAKINKGITTFEEVASSCHI